ncbi:hypothetical protein SPBR_01016 [Sporothrix brasiliensis 5110]|uniref:HNH nuclease domain-containing protein n=1 Tax=Sporothrix brasiliensis 5110 TaxID=1398154 RepID=A0A0C2ETX1_9PEZI|nr:uncharacterized protein SPBR_01016 [Sporothrix brasiliensis 5110]KIH89984.1 hypothetical protein SPBR_01016 [Sporothrix brasiliensis 5110]
MSESPRNMICLSKHLHALWGAARFGLKPLRDPQAVERNEVWVQFHWLAQGLLRPSEEVGSDAMDRLGEYGMDPTFVDAGSDSKIDRRGRNGTLAHQESGQRIETGQVFVIKADDPELLPSLEILELQWALVRLAALSGAADVYCDHYSDDHDAVSLIADAEGYYERIFDTGLERQSQSDYADTEDGAYDADAVADTDVTLLDLDESNCAFEEEPDI